jgi:DNA-directed RNA polymerase specialized sigma24 family protein
MSKYVTDYGIVHLREDFEKRRPQLNKMALSQFPLFSPRDRVRLAGDAVEICGELLEVALSEGRVLNRKHAWVMMKHCLYLAVKSVRSANVPEEVGYTETQLQAEFTDQYQSLLRQAHAFLITKPQSRRDEIISDALPLAWYYARQALAKGRIRDKAEAGRFLGMSLHWAILHALRGQTLENTMPFEWKHGAKRDVYDRKSPYKEREPVERMYEEDPEVENVAFRIDISEFMAKLTEPQRLVLQAFLQGHSGAQIAHIFGRSAETIRTFKAEIREVFERHFG